MTGNLGTMPPEYHMGRKGKVVIFKHSQFQSQAKLPDLVSSATDCAKMHGFWKNQQVSNVKVHYDLNAEDLGKIVDEISKDEDLANADFLVLVFLTYGDQGLVYANDRPVALQKLIAPLKADKCLHLAGKPKLIILQTTLPVLQADASPEKVTTIPSEADFMYLWSRMPADKFMENPASGSLFISKLIEMMKTHKDLDMLKIMTRTLAAVQAHLEAKAEWREQLHADQQLPFVTNQLRKALYIK